MRNDEMLCVACQMVVDFSEKSYATSHLRSGKHKKMKVEATKRVTSPGSSAATPAPVFKGAVGYLRMASINIFLSSATSSAQGGCTTASKYREK